MTKNRTTAVIVLALALAFNSAGAEARTTTPSPSATATPRVDVVVFCQAWDQPYGTLLTMKTHPQRVVALGLSCEDVTPQSRGQFYRQACEIIAATYGRWVVNKAWLGEGKQLVWEPLRCNSVLLPAVPHGALSDWRL